VLPYGAALQALRDSWTGQTPELLHLAVLAVTTVVGPLAASRVFRWQ
jgi:ABC-2 type transport system permease protein